jgi:hypothetical protein
LLPHFQILAARIWQVLMAGSCAQLAGQRGSLMFSLLHSTAALLPFHHQILAAKIWKTEEGEKKERKQVREHSILNVKQ